MAKQLKIFGAQITLDWFRVKTKFKHLLRRVSYGSASQELICWILIGYMKLVFHSSKKIYLNEAVFCKALQTREPLMVATWHNRLMLIPFFVSKAKKINPNRQIFALASRHGDGQFISKIMTRFGSTPILGSTQDKRKASRGINIASFKKIFTSLKQGNALAITPDGPRGPSQKINGEIVNIARIAQAGILPITYSSSRFKKLNTWDKFLLPLPFSTLCFACDEEVTYVAKEASAEELENIKQRLEDRMNALQEKSQEMVFTQSRK